MKWLWRFSFVRTVSGLIACLLLHGQLRKSPSCSHGLFRAGQFILRPLKGTPARVSPAAGPQRPWARHVFSQSALASAYTPLLSEQSNREKNKCVEKNLVRI